MKPLRLVFEGVRSFTDKVEIDFERLSSGGLFGIFGPTGSGKSTILDAIILALYGKVSGLNMAEIINTRCRKASVCFEFSIVDNCNRKKYRVEREFTLNKDSSYRNSTAFLYEMQEGTLISVAEKTDDVNEKVETVIGLGVNEFTKCIILPQGEFSQFVKSTKSERIKIIEKLFDLEKYGERFTAKLKSKINSLQIKIAGKEGELSTLAEYTKEALLEVEKLENDARKEYNLISENLLKINDYIDKNKGFYVSYKRMKDESGELENLKESEEQIDKKRNAVELYEKAVKVKDAGEALEKAIYNVSEQKVNYDTIIKKYNKTILEKEKCEDDFNRLPEIAEEKSKLIIKKNNLTSAKTDFEDIKKFDGLIFECNGKINNFVKDKESTVTKINELNKEKVEVDRQIKFLENQTDISVAFAFAINGALANEFSEQIKYYDSRIEDISKYADDSKFYLEVESEARRRKNEFSDRLTVISNQEKSSDENSTAKYFKLSKEKSNAENRFSKILIEIEKLNGNISTIDTEIKNCKENLNLFANRKNEIKEKIISSFGEIIDFEQEFKICEKNVTILDEKEDSIRGAYKKVNEELNALVTEKSKVESDIEKLQEICKQKQMEFDNTLGNGIDNLADAKQILQLTGDVNVVIEEIKKYDERTVFLTKSIERVKLELEKVDFSYEKYCEEERKKVDIVKNREEMIKILGNYQNNTENFSQNFSKRCIIEKDVNSLRACARVYDKLWEAVSKKAFAEFIATEFLQDIAEDARKTLLELTSGKYDVKYQDSNNGKDGFYVLDNLNGGVLRSVTSLSGGETFLVSLSLALSLSSNIYASSNKPMEFFFLDEGFGTLDDNLVDTVVDSLEKLKNNNFSIGLISHLAELKSRIDNKILVTSADETKGSSIKVIF